MLKMFINPMMPQTSWAGPPPSDNIFASESHLRGNREKEISYHRRSTDDFSCLFCSILNGSVSQRQLERKMDDQQFFQNMTADSGDEAYTTEAPYNDYFPGISSSTPNARAQTTATGVSAVGTGRNFGPSHSQQNKEPAGNEQLFWPNVPTANAYTRGHGTDFDLRQSPWQMYNTAGGSQQTSFLDFPDGLPGQNWHSPLPIFGEPLEYTQVSPSSVSSSATSAASESMHTMALDSMTTPRNAVGNPQVESSFPIMDNSRNTWGTSCPSTISPKMLRINPSPTPASSSESIHTSLLTAGDSGLGTPGFEHHAHSPYPSQRPSQRQRRELPNKPAKSRPVSVASRDSPSFKDKGLDYPRQPASRQRPSHKAKVIQPKRERQDTVPYELERSEAHERGIDLGNIDEGRSAKDDFLVKSKLAGMTYREIRLKGNFTEAESTLRGRFRTLTKTKEERVRKPEWQENDIRLLRKAVRKLCKGDVITSTKIPWKQVADYITDHGGSYHFGYATCHRKWEQLSKQDDAVLN